MKDKLIEDMYSTINVSLDETDKTDQSIIKVTKRGMISEVEISGKKISTVDPRSMQDLVQMIKDLQKTISVLEQGIRQLTARIDRTDRMLERVKQELDTKISYER